MPIITIVSSFMIAVLISSALFVSNPLSFLVLCLSLGFLYYSAVTISKPLLSEYGAITLQSNRKQLSLLSQGLRLFRDIRIDDNAEFFVHIFTSNAKHLRNAQVNTKILAGSLRIAIEQSSLAIFITVIYILSYAYGSFEQAAPLIALFVYGSQKLIPYLQKIFDSLSLITSAKADLKAVNRALKTSNAFQVLQTFSASVSESKLPPLYFKSLELRDISYTYPDAESPVIDSVSLQLLAGDILGIAGQTGTGKSTLINIISLLTPPTCGSISLNGKPLDLAAAQSGYIQHWYALITHVPQDPFLLDSSIYENIGFGLKDDEVDYDLVKYAEVVACISEVIERLPNNYHTLLHDNGKQLSGGQRQRIAIARAVYKHGQVLILDEATSALDKYTEERVFESLRRSSHFKSIIIITHSPTVLGICNKVIELPS